MRRSDVVYIVGCAFAAVTSFAYCCTMWFHIKLPRYYPMEHTWKWVREAGVPSQGWYGMQAFAYLVGAAGALVLYMVLRRSALKQMVLKPYPARMLGVVTTVLIAVCLGYIFVHEFSRWGVFSKFF